MRLTRKQRVGMAAAGILGLVMVAAAYFGADLDPRVVLGVAVDVADNVVPDTDADSGTE